MSRSIILTNSRDKCKMFFVFYYVLLRFYGGFQDISPDSALRTRVCLGKPSGIFLHQPAGNHNLMSASHAFEPEISSHPEDFPLAAAAGMGFFELYYVPYFIIQLFVHVRDSISVYRSDRRPAVTLSECLLSQPVPPG